MTAKKIKIIDDEKIRKEIDAIYEKQSQIILVKWSLKIIEHIIQVTNFDSDKYPEITEGVRVNELWQNNKIRAHEIRQIGFKIHKTG